MSERSSSSPAASASDPTTSNDDEQDAAATPPSHTRTIVRDPMVTDEAEGGDAPERALAPGSTTRLVRRTSMHGAVERWAGWHRPTDQGAVVEIHGHLRARGSDEAEAMLGVMRRAADVRHAHLVRQLAFGLGVDGAPYVVTERLLGPTLEEHVQARGPLPVEEIYEILAQLTSALAAVHARGLVHGGLSPCRVLLCRAEDGGHFVRLLACDLAALRGAVAGVSEAVGTAGFVDEDLRGLGRLVRLMCAGASTDLVPPRAPGPALDRWFFAAEAPRENGFTSARALADAFLEAIGGLTVARILAEFPRPAREE